MPLLATSRQLQALVAGCCSGRLAGRHTLHCYAHAESLALFLPKHGTLLASMELCLDLRSRRDAPAAGLRGDARSVERPLAALPAGLHQLAVRDLARAPFEQQLAHALASSLATQAMRLRSLELPQLFLYVHQHAPVAGAAAPHRAHQPRCRAAGGRRGWRRVRPPCPTCTSAT